MRPELRWFLCALIAGCGGGGDGGGGGDDAGSGDAAPDAATDADAEVTEDAAPPIALQVVPGDLVYAEGAPGDFASVHLFSATASGDERHRITRNAGGWTFAAVGPDPRFVAAVRHEDANADGRPDANGRRAVWVIDVQSHDEYPVTPAECDAGIGGVGWRDDVRILLAMRCGDEPSAVYLVNRDNRGRERDNLLRISDHEEPVRDVFSAVGTPLYTYVVDTRACEGDACVTKPQVWLADHDAPARCRVTDGDPGLRDVGRADVRVGDHHPAFNGDLTKVVFSRNVAGKPAGPEGHLDLFRVGLDLGALYSGQATCGRPSSLERLSDAFIEDAYDVPGGGRVAGDERYPEAAAGRAPPGAMLFTAEARDGERTLQQVFTTDVDGSKQALTPARRAGGYGRWIVERYTRSAGQ